jgi:hypothetical protein
MRDESMDISSYLDLLFSDTDKLLAILRAVSLTRNAMYWICLR